MTLFKSIRRAAQPTVIKTVVAGSVLLLPAIVSRIQKTVTVPAPKAQPVVASPVALPPVVAQSEVFKAEPKVAAKLSAPKKGVKRRVARVAKEVAPAVVAAPVAAAQALVTESPLVAEAAETTPPTSRPLVFDTQADFARLVKKESPPPGNELPTSPVVAEKESEEKKQTEIAPEPELTALPLTEEEKLVEALLAESHEGNEAVEVLRAQPKIDAETEVTTAPVEGEIVASDFSSLETSLLNLKKEWSATKQELTAALKPKAPALTEPTLIAPLVKAPTPTKTAETPAPVIKAAEPTLVSKDPMPAAPLFAQLKTPAVEAPVETAPSETAPPTYEIGKKDSESGEPTQPTEAPVVAEVTSAPEVSASETPKEAEPEWANYRKNEKDETEDGPTLVSPSLSPAAELAAMAIQPKVTTQAAALVAAPTLTVPQASRSVAHAAIAQANAEEKATEPPPAPARVLDASAEIAALTHAAPQSVTVAVADTARGPSAVLPQLTERHVAPYKPEPEEASDDSQATAEEAGELESDREDGGQGVGYLEMEPALESWLDKYKGHIELSLVPVRGRNPNDAIHLDPDEFSFPEPEFQFTTEGLKGSYRLMAEFFAEGSADVIAKVAYPEKITADSYKKKIAFRLGFRDFQRARFLRANKARGLSMTLTIFEGASGNYRYPRAITHRKNARVEIEGFPELGFFKANRRGNVVIPRVPSHSTLRLHVLADGFYDTHVTVPTGTSSVYAPVFLVSRDQVSAVTQHFTKRPQQNNKGVILARVFNSKTRTPLAGEEFSLQYRKGKAVYFHALPDLELNETTKTGLLGFFNVSSSPRGLKRASKPFPYLLDIAPGSAVYLELGRGGEKSLKGQMRNPFHAEIPQAAIRLAGTGRGEEVYSTPRGSFEIDGLDFPTGTVRVEVEPEGMPTFLYDVAWNPRDKVKTDSFTVFDREVISSSVKTYGKQNWKSNLGTVIGGAQPEFFRGRNECISVTLESLAGRTLDEKSGPFLLGGGEVNKGDKLCLNEKKSRVTFVNLAPGPYLLKWRNATGQTIRAREVNVELKKVSVSVD